MKFKEMFEYLSNSQLEITKLQEEALPSVGIFYFVDTIMELQNINLPVARIRNKSLEELKNQFEHLGLYVMQVEDDLYIGYNSLHANMFRDVIRRLHLSIKKYDDIPRGRIMYNASKNQFECVMDKCLDNDQTKKLIKKEFNISNLNFNFDDKNYTCLKCRGKN